MLPGNNKKIKWQSIILTVIVEWYLMEYSKNEQHMNVVQSNNLLLKLNWIKFGDNVPICYVY